MSAETGSFQRQDLSNNNKIIMGKDMGKGMKKKESEKKEKE